MVVALAAVSLMLVAGCSGRSGSETNADSGGEKESTSQASGDFGQLSGVCGPGDAKAASAQGVTADEIKVGVFSDVGFTKNSEFVDAAKVFTSWCNEAGGINGRKITADTRDAKLMEVRQRMLEACKEDFALVGGGAALDGLGVKERLNCLLPSFTAQASQPQSVGADLDIAAAPTRVAGYDPYFGFRTWLLKEAYPESAAAVGIINGDSPVTKSLGPQAIEAIQAAGGTVVYDELYPAMGVSDWTPYAQGIKNKGVKGLVFYGDFKQLAKLEESLTTMDYKLDWIDANSNAYSQSFLDLLGKSASYQNNVLDLGGVAPLESSEPAIEQVKQMYEQYAPDAQITLPAVRAISSWLLFAKSAGSCGDELTRKCVYDAARGETAWMAGGLQAPVDVSQPKVQGPCFNIEQATADGWQSADFQPDNGLYRCDTPPFKLQGDYGAPLTLAAVGKSMSDVQ
ncbi:MAG: ABC transporter substrate-binding protein [Aldersonia sp.]|nr:ABC transporter substrate-binding protein [Aldersonia sp.]